MTADDVQMVDPQGEEESFTLTGEELVAQAKALQRRTHYQGHRKEGDLRIILRPLKKTRKTTYLERINKFFNAFFPIMEICL